MHHFNLKSVLVSLIKNVIIKRFIVIQKHADGFFLPSAVSAGIHFKLHLANNLHQPTTAAWIKPETQNKGENQFIKW